MLLEAQGLPQSTSLVLTTLLDPTGKPVSTLNRAWVKNRQSEIHRATIAGSTAQYGMNVAAPRFVPGGGDGGKILVVEYAFTVARPLTQPWGNHAQFRRQGVMNLLLADGSVTACDDAEITPLVSAIYDARWKAKQDPGLSP
ncbi:MAG: hypothetical protein ACKO1M_00355 [Planctomycetota bacterium]